MIREERVWVVRDRKSCTAKNVEVDSLRRGEGREGLGDMILIVENDRLLWAEHTMFGPRPNREDERSSGAPALV